MRGKEIKTPKYKTIKFFYLSYFELPFLKLNCERKRYQTKILIFNSKKSIFSYSIIDQFYRFFYQANIHLINIKSNSLKLYNSSKINYFLKKNINDLNISGFRNLVFEGAGVRAIAYSGAIIALESLGIIDNIHRFAGTSAGAIYALFLSIGCNANEIKSIVSNIDYKKFMDSSSNFLSNSKRLLTDFGWYKGEDFIETLKKIITNKLNKDNVTFISLKMITGNDLFIIGTNLSRSCAEIYSAETTPNMPVIEAVRISTCIPMFFKAVKRNNKGIEEILVDGGLVWNNPLDIFDNKKYLKNLLNKTDCYRNNEQSIINYETIGFRLDPLKDPFLVAKREIPKKYHKINHIFDFARSFMNFYSISALKRHLESEHWSRVIFIDTLDIMGTDFDISSKQIEKLIDQGKIGVYNHFVWRVSKDGLKFPQ